MNDPIPARKVWTAVGAVEVPGPVADIIDELFGALEKILPLAEWALMEQSPPSIDQPLVDNAHTALDNAKPPVASDSVREIGIQCGLGGDRLDLYEKYVTTRFPNSHPTYITEWANRFFSEYEYAASDATGQALLDKLMMV